MRGMTAIKRFDVSGIPSGNLRWRGFEGDERNAVLRSRFYELLAGFALPAEIPCYDAGIPCFAAEQGIASKAPGLLLEIAVSLAKMVKKGRVLQKFPVLFPVFRESGLSVRWSRQASYENRKPDDQAFESGRVSRFGRGCAEVARHRSGSAIPPPDPEPRVAGFRGRSHLAENPAAMEGRRRVPNQRGFAGQRLHAASSADLEEIRLRAVPTSATERWARFALPTLQPRETAYARFTAGTGQPGIFTRTDPSVLWVVKNSVFQSSPPKAMLVVCGWP